MVLHQGVRRLQIELDKGPEIASSRTQFMKRLIDFVDRYDQEIELVYFPPYHSKHNPIERFWGVLEKPWNGTLLNAAATVVGVVGWASSATWRGVHPIVHQNTSTYRRGVTTVDPGSWQTLGFSVDVV